MNNKSFNFDENSIEKMDKEKLGPIYVFNIFLFADASVKFLCTCNSENILEKYIKKHICDRSIDIVEYQFIKYIINEEDPNDDNIVLIADHKSDTHHYFAKREIVLQN